MNTTARTRAKRKAG